METRYQRVAREQRERQAARAKREKARLKLERRASRRKKLLRHEESIEDRQDDLGESPDY